MLRSCKPKLNNKRKRTHSISTPNPKDGQPTHLFISGGFPPQKAHTDVHPEVLTGILVHAFIPPPPKQKCIPWAIDLAKRSVRMQEFNFWAGRRAETASGGQPAPLPLATGEVFMLSESGTVVWLLLLPPGVPSMPAPACSTQSLSQDHEVRRVLTITDAGNGIEGQKVPDQQVLPISGPQHASGILRIVSRFTARAVCSGCCLVVGPRESVVAGVCPIKALRGGLHRGRGGGFRELGKCFAFNFQFQGPH